MYYYQNGKDHLLKVIKKKYFNEKYRIYEINYTSPITYTLIDNKNNIIKDKFYAEDLQLTNKNV